MAACLDLFVGVTYGAVSALMGGKVDAIMQRIIEVLVGIPHLIIVILLMMVLPAGVGTIIVALAITGWVNMARLVRARILQLKGQEFVEAARSLGIGHMKILFRHIAPNLFGSVIVYTTLAVPGIMLLEAVLSFLGLGVKAPNSSWGTLIKEGADRMEVSPELLLFPALLFSATLLALNFLGDGLRDALDPKSSKD